LIVVLNQLLKPGKSLNNNCPLNITTMTNMMIHRCTTMLVVNQPMTASEKMVNCSWNDGASKTAIVDFGKRVTSARSPDFVPFWQPRPPAASVREGVCCYGEKTQPKPSRIRLAHDSLQV
jgi:hypothetical protein